MAPLPFFPCQCVVELEPRKGRCGGGGEGVGGESNIRHEDGGARGKTVVTVNGASIPTEEKKHVVIGFM